MPGFVREHLRPLLGSAGLHVAIIAVLAGAALEWTSKQPPVQLAIEGVVVDARDLPNSISGSRPTPRPTARPVPAPEPVVEPPPPEPAPAPQEDLAAKRRAAEEAAAAREKAEAQEKARVETERRQAAERETTAKAEAQRAAEAERKQEEQARAAHDAKLRAERESELKRQLAAEEEEGAAVARAGVIDEYRALLAQTIERNWIRPPSARAGLECTLFVTQAPGGTVVDVQLGACNGDQSVRESIVNAVYRASPLPAPRDPRAFERKLQIVFKPTE